MNVPLCLKTVTCCLLLLPLAGGQGKHPEPAGSKALARAVVVEEGEHDHRQALRLFQALARDKKADPAVRTQAWLRLGRLYLKLGQAAPGQEALRQAARGQGPAALSAAALLGGAGLDAQQRLERAIQRAIQKLGGAQAARREGRRELTWIGLPAVPYLTGALKRAVLNPDQMITELSTLYAIEGPKLALFLGAMAASPDKLLRRALALALTTLPWRSADPTLVAAARLFLKDADPAVRREALHSLREAIGPQEIELLCRDVAPEVRVEAQDWLTTELVRRRGARIPGKQALPWIKRGVLDPDRRVRQAAYAALAPSVLWQHPLLMDFLLELIGRTELWQRPEEARLFLQAGPDGRNPKKTPRLYSRPAGVGGPRAPALLQVAQKLGPARGEQGFGWDLPARRRYLLAVLVQNLIKSFPDNDLQAVLELTHLGYVSEKRTLRWMRHLPERHHPLVLVRDLIRWHHPGEALDVYRGGRSYQEKPVLRALQEFASLRLKQAPPLGGQRMDGPLMSCLHVLARSDDATSQRFLAGIIRKHKEAMGLLAANFFRDPQAWDKDLLLALLDGGFASVSNVTALIRNIAFVELLVRGEKRALGMFPKAYALGLEEVQGYLGPRNTLERGFLALKTVASGYDLTELVRILDACLVARTPQAFVDAVQLALFLESSATHPRLLATLAQALLRHWEGPGRSFGLQHEAAKAILKSGVPGLPERLVAHLAVTHQARLLQDVLPRLSRADSLALRPVIEKLLTHKTFALVMVALNVLTRLGGRASLEAIYGLLQSPRPKVRVLALKALAKGPRPELTRIRVLLKDPVADVRQAACHTLARFPDRASVPDLLSRLADDDAEVRYAATTTLTTLRDYFELTRGWKDWAAGRSLSAPSAAAALLKQAGPGNPPEVRLLAIQSLGTLGKPETLPFLIQLVATEKGAIGAAARRALERINMKPRQEGKK